MIRNFQIFKKRT